MNDIDRFFDDEMWSGGNFSPAMDIYQDGDNVMAKVSLPDIDPEKVDVSVENDVLTISGKTSSVQEAKEEDFYRKEIREGSFSRSVVLPMQVKGSETRATYKKGMLVITMPKADEAKPQRIAIESEEK
jgi:HSP20 family protein